jgi:hypothetical protein
MPEEGRALQNALMQMPGCEHPGIQAPMARRRPVGYRREQPGTM